MTVDAYFGGWTAGVDPDLFALWHCSQVSTEERPELFNYIGYCNPEVDEIIEAGLATRTRRSARTSISGSRRSSPRSSRTSSPTPRSCGT